VSGGSFPCRFWTSKTKPRALKEGLEAEHYEVVASATGEDVFFGRPHVYKAALDTQQK
jgi:hypothetical protein